MAMRKVRIPTWLCNSRMVSDHSRIVQGIFFSFIDEVDALCKVGIICAKLDMHLFALLFLEKGRSIK